MTKSFTVSAFLEALLVVALATSLASCGGGVMSGMNTRQLQSITITPANASATNGGPGVQFAATGMYNITPMSVMSPPVMWSVGMPFSAAPVPAGVTVDANGMALCSGFMGTIMIEATAPMDPTMPLSKMTMMTSNVAGAAQLTCS
jgi:hypothetical protein